MRLSHVATVLIIMAGFVIHWSPDLHAGTFTAPALANGNGEDYTIVEVDPFFSGGLAGNTVQTADAGLFWSAPNGNDALWWPRTDVASLSAGYVDLDLEATQRIYVLNLTGDPGNPDDNAVELKTTISGLEPGGYDVFSVYAGGSARSVTSDLESAGVTEATTLRSSLLGTDPVIAFGASFGRDIILDPLGTTAAGVTSFSVFTKAGSFDVGNRTYWIGVAYQQSSAIPEPSTFLLAALGLLGLLSSVRRRRK